MNAPVGKLIVRGGMWTIGVYCLSVAVRFSSNVVVSRLITPEIFGAVVIITTLRSGVELLSDVGVGQNIVNSPDGETPAFRNTAWTIQFMRGVILALVFTALAGLISSIYAVPEGALVITAATFALMGLSSTSIYLIQRRLQFARLNLFDLAQDVVAAVCVVIAAAISPTLWSVLVAQAAAVAIRTASSFLLPDAHNRLQFDLSHAVRILTWGKWIYLWSLLSFLSVNLDRIFLGRSTTLAALGLYGLARTMADLPVALVGRLGHSLIFPLLSSFGSGPRDELRLRVARLRLTFMLASAVALAPAIAFGDIAIDLIYDPRYAASGWMLPVLLVCAWGTVLCVVSEYSLLGIGKPVYGALANAAKVGCLLIAMPLAFAAWGLAGAILALGLGECARYASLVAGQMRERMVFAGQDLAASLALAAGVVLLTMLREAAGFGSAFSRLPLP